MESDVMEQEKIEIYGTFGPACKAQDVLEDMIRCGMTGMRLNLSHTTLKKSKEYIDNYKKAASKLGLKPQILIDMQGPELRIGNMDEIYLQEKQTAMFVSNAAISGTETSKDLVVENTQEILRIPVPVEVLEVIKTNMQVLLDDGKIRTKVLEVTGQEAVVQVLMGGKLKSHKSIKIVDVNVTMPILTNYDMENIRQAKEYGVTALMQPFVFSGEDLKKVRELLKKEKMEFLKIFAKIENRMGVEHLDSILPEADLIVIARGDLGNDMPLWELPKVQKNIELACKKYDKPYMVVTQMLSSMEENPLPTRAEVSDIFHAVYHGAKAVMVTGETAVGKYPVEVIKYLSNTALEAKRYLENKAE